MPQKITPRQRQDKLASFTYTDLLTGRSYIRYYAGKGRSQHIINGNSFYSDSITTTYFKSSSEETIDFDSPVTSTFVIDGSAIISATLELSGTPQTTMSGAIIRVRDGIETELGTARLITRYATDGSKRATEAVDLAKTRFRNGDILRLRTTVTTNDPGGAPTAILYHSPKNRTAGLSDTATGGILEAFVPFNVNI